LTDAEALAGEDFLAELEALSAETVATERFAVAATARAAAVTATVIPCSSMARNTAFILCGDTLAASSASRTSAPVTLPNVVPRAMSFWSWGCENSVGNARSAL